MGKITEALKLKHKTFDLKHLVGVLQRQDWYTLLQHDRRTGILDLTDSSLIKDGGTIERLLDCGLIDPDGRLSPEGLAVCRQFMKTTPLSGRRRKPIKPLHEDPIGSADSKSGPTSNTATAHPKHYGSNAAGDRKVTVDLRLQSPPAGSHDAGPPEKLPEEANFAGNGISPDLVTLHQPYSFEAEQFRRLRSAIMFRNAAPVPRVILVTSASPAEGKSFVAANLAATIAMNLERHVLLLDCDLRRPSVHRLFGIKAEPGLSDHLASRHDLTHLVQRVGLPRMSVVAAGASPPNPVELLTSERMVRLLDEVRSRYDDRLVVLDSPPAMVAAELNVLAGFSDGIVLVVKERGPKREDIMEVVRQLDPKKLLGIVGNFSGARSSGYYKKNKYYQHYYQKR